MTSPSAAATRWQYALLAILFALIWFGSLDYRKLIKPDEGRYAEIPREMAASGDWVTPRLNGLKYFEKPPLQYWATAATYKVFGLSEWSARIWPALTGFLGVLLAWFTGRRLFGPTAGWFAALALGCQFAYIVIGHMATLDMALCFFLQLMVSGFLLAGRDGLPPLETRNWMLVAWAGAALAVLSKGFVSLVLPGATLVLYSLLTRDLAPWRRLHVLPGLALFLVIAAPWHVLAALRNPEFFDFYFIHEHFTRFLTTEHRRVEPFWYFGPVLFAAAMPWTTVAVHGAIAQWKGPEKTPGKAPKNEAHALRFLALWCVVTFGFFSASGSKLPSYILPILPAFALLTGRYLTLIGRRALQLHIAAVALLAIACVGVAPTISHRADAQSPLEMMQNYAHVILGASLFWLAACVAALWLAWRNRKATAALVLSAGSFIGFTSAQLGHESLSRSNSAYHIAQQVKPVIAPDAPFYSVQMYEQTLTPYLGRTVTLVDYRDEMDLGLQQEPEKGVPTVAQFIARWNTDPVAYAIMSHETYSRLQAQGLPMTVIARDTRRIIVKKP